MDWAWFHMARVQALALPAAAMPESSGACTDEGNSLMALAAWMATVAKDIGRLGLTFTVGAAIVTVGFSVAMATGMRALLWLIHGLHAPDSKIKSVL